MAQRDNNPHSHGSLPADRRTGTRAPVKIDVNYRHGETYLFSRSSDVSELGIFLVSKDPLPVATRLELEFRLPDGGERFVVEGEVVWVNMGSHGHEPGMGIQFVTPSSQARMQLSALVRTIAYLE